MHIRRPSTLWLFRISHAIAASLAFALLSACSGGGSGDAGAAAAPAPPPPPPPPPAITKVQAFEFLNRATFGATEAEAARVIQLGYEAWIDAELAKPASLELPYIQSLPVPTNIDQLHINRAHIWAFNSLQGPDQLRQRVAFALSEILVVSQVGALQNSPYSVASYYDLLAVNAFGNFRDLMEEVTLHPAMGVYLSMLGNQKPDPTRNIRPDENYARELLQLFTIGLVELNLDGSERVDAFGEPIPTFTQEIVEGFAHVYTGWHYAGAASFGQARQTLANQVIPMQLYATHHDTGPKRLLNGFMTPSGQTGQADLDFALNNIFNHPNVGPFIAERLIQRLVTSNPSPAYIERVAARFNNNGAGVRGDLGAVVKAILLDPESRIATDRSGKLKEPLLRLTQLWRAFDARSASGQYPMSNATTLFGQGPLQAGSVFNFFSPFFAPAGEIRNGGLVAPELQIATEYQNTQFANAMWTRTMTWNSANRATLAPDVVYIDIAGELAIQGDTFGLVDRVVHKLLGGQISPQLRSETVGMVNRYNSQTQATQRVAEAIYLIVTSPEYAYQR